MNRPFPPLARIAVSLGGLAVLALLLDPAGIGRRLTRLEPGWVAAALGLSVLQVGASAWRWRYTAARLDVRLGRGEALAEYYLATFLNQLLPGGVAGDVSRAWRHGRRSGPAAPPPGLAAVHAVVLERASGQVVMTAVALVSAVVLLAPRGGELRVWMVVAAGLVAFLVGARAVSRRLVRLPVARRLLADARRALWGSALPAQVASSALVVATYVATWIAADRAVGLDTPLPLLLPLVAPVLVTMLLPVSVAGWGVREGAAAALWGAVGLGPSEGVAVSVAYGLLVLAGSVPGAAVLLFSSASPRGRGRRGDRSPTGSAAPVAGAPGPGAPPPAG